MLLEQTRKKLRNLFNKYDPLLREAKKELRPNWGERGDGGHAYYNIEPNDIDDIYSAISDLSLIVSSAEGPILFDIEGYFISEKKALNELKNFSNLIEQQIVQLKEIQEKYKPRECAHYPIDTCLSYHQELFDLLSEILNTDEIQEFESPGLIDRLKNQIEAATTKVREFQFNEYWRKRRWAYWLHLISFFIFLAGVCWLAVKKENVIAGVHNYPVIVLLTVISILFNILFNNHTSFKNSWKLILPKSRKKLIAEEKQIFFKKLSQG